MLFQIKPYYLSKSMHYLYIEHTRSKEADGSNEALELYALHSIRKMLFI